MQLDVETHLIWPLYRQLTPYGDTLSTRQDDTEWSIHILCHAYFSHTFHLMFRRTYAR